MLAVRVIVLKGIDSVMASKELRDIAWKKLSTLLDVNTLKKICKIMTLAEVNEVATDIVNGQIKGRVVIDVNKV